MKILAVALSGIGDALMFTPAVIKLKELMPDAEIDVLAMFKGVESIYANNPLINKILYYDFLHAKPFDALMYVLSIRGKYDAVINIYPSNRKEYNIISFLTGAKKRAAVKYLRMDFRNLGFLNNVVVKEDDSLHNVEENIRMVEKLTGKKINEIPPLDFPLDDDDIDFASQCINGVEIEDDEIVIGLHPGCAILKNHIKRRWEPEKFSQLGKRLIDELGAKILIFGGPDEQELKENVFNGINSKSAFIADTGSLAQTAAVMKRCNLFITNDSSLMHVASAMRLNVIAIIGPTNTNYIRPWNTKHEIVSLNLECSPCFYYSPKPLTCVRTDLQFKCIKELTPDMVYDAAVRALKKEQL